MKNKIKSLSWAVVCGGLMLAAVSCEKMNVAEEGGQDANVVLRIQSFEQTPFPARTRAAAENVCSRLCFHIYDDSGERVTYTNQKQEGDNFGNAFFTLPKGHYYIIVVGHSASNNPSFNKNEVVKISGGDLGDTFWCVKELEVEDEKIEESVTLNRIVSRLCFIPTDIVPESLSEIIFRYKGSKGTFNGLTGYGSTTTTQTVPMNVSADDGQFGFYMIPRVEQDTIDLEIKTYQDEGVPLCEKKINDVPVHRNRITICRGPLFDQDSSDQMIKISIVINDTWGDPINLPFL